MFQPTTHTHTLASTPGPLHFPSVTVSSPPPRPTLITLPRRPRPSLLTWQEERLDKSLFSRVANKEQQRGGAKNITHQELLVVFFSQ